MAEEKILNCETLVSAIKEVAEAIAENGGSQIRARVIENSGELLMEIIIEPYRFIEKEGRK